MQRTKRMLTGVRGWGAATCMVAAALIPCAPVMAQQTPAPAAEATGSTEPVVVVSISGVDEVGGAVSYLAEAVGQPGPGGMFAAMAAGFTQGIDPARPIGITVNLVDGAPAPVAFVPTSDISRFLKRIEEQVGPAEKLDDGTFVIAAGANLLYIRQQGEWAFASQNREFLADLPGDPRALLDGMHETYDLAVRLNVQQVPENLRGVLIEQMKQGFAQAAARQGEDAQQMGRQTLEQLARMINETQRLQIGWSVDPATRRTFLDLEIIAVEGTELAEIYDGARPIPSDFASVIRPDAALYYHAAASVSPKAVEQARESLDQSLAQLEKQLTKDDDLSPEQVADIEELVQRLGKVAIDTIAEGKIDLGVVVMAGTEKLQVTGGAFVADGNELVAILKDLSGKVANEPNAPRFQFDQGEYNGVTMHTVEADVPADKEEARKVFGPVLQVKLGTSDQAFYLAMGGNAEARMKELIDSAGQDRTADRPLGQAFFSLLPVLQFAQSIESQDEVAAMIDAIARSGETDRINVVSESVPRGQKVRIAVGEGILRAIGAGVREKNRAEQGGGQF